MRTYASPRNMSVGSADRLAVAVQEGSSKFGLERAGWFRDTTRMLACHDFAAVNVCELRVLGRFGSGGKLRVSADHQGVLSASVSAYREDECSDLFPAGVFGRVDAAARGVVLDWEPSVLCQPARDRAGGGLVAHALADPDGVDVEDDWRPLVCGSGVVLPGPTVDCPAGCMVCRWGVASDRGVWRWLCELDDLLGRLDGMASFPRSRRVVLAWQREVLSGVLVSPRAGLAGSMNEYWVAHVGGSVLTDDVGTLVGSFARWVWQVLFAHRDTSRSRFPLAADTDELLAVGRDLGLGGR